MIVVDASVAVKWFVQEEFSQQAADLRTISAAQGVMLVGPELLPIEMANAILWQQRRGAITREEADSAIAEYPRHGVEIYQTRHLIPTAMSFSRRYTLPAIYDAMYVVLAQELDAEFWTADKRLYRAVADQAPWVHWIADWGME